MEEAREEAMDAEKNIIAIISVTGDDYMMVVCITRFTQRCLISF
jgi:hypothetical protein